MCFFVGGRRKKERKKEEEDHYTHSPTLPPISYPILPSFLPFLSFVGESTNMLYVKE